MNFNQVKLFLYGIGMIFEDHFNQKEIIFSSDKGYISAVFYDDSVFKNEDDKTNFRKLFIDTFLDTEKFSDGKLYLQENPSVAFHRIERFVLSHFDSENTEDITLYNVDFLEKTMTQFPFLIMDSSTKFKPVSLILDKK